MPNYDFFTPTASLEQIHQAALRILDEIGIDTDHGEIRARGWPASAAGIARTRICFPPGLIASTLAAIPPSFRLYGHTPEITALVGAGGLMLFTNTGILPDVYDLDTGALRRATLADVAATTAHPGCAAERGHRLCLAARCHRPAAAPDHPGRLRGHAGEHHKPLIGPGVANGAEAEAIVAMARTLARPGAGTLSGLRPVHLPDHAAALARGAGGSADRRQEAGLPLEVIANPVMGITAPYTIAGTVALGMRCWQLP